MYPPPHHQTDNKKQMIAVMKAYPFAMLVSAEGDTPYVTHIPVIYNDATGKLVAHIDTQNPQVKTLINGAKVTVVFKGPDCYISPSVYNSEQLPTWNYIIVHITGTISLINDATAAKQTMVAMTQFLEQPEPQYTLDINDPKMDRLVHYIQAFTIEINHWEGKFKLSQDKSIEDFELAKNKLIDSQSIESQKLLKDLYSKF